MWFVPFFVSFILKNIKAFFTGFVQFLKLITLLVMLITSAGLNSNCGLELEIFWKLCTTNKFDVTLKKWRV